MNWNDPTPSDDDEMPDLIIMGPEDNDDVDTIQSFHCELLWNDLINQGYNINEDGIIDGKHLTKRMIGVKHLYEDWFGPDNGDEGGSHTSKKCKTTESDGEELNAEL